MNRAKLLELWNDQWTAGNWIPSWPDALVNLTFEESIWTPVQESHSIWQELVHVNFWRQATLRLLAGGERPTDEETAQLEFAQPYPPTPPKLEATLAQLKATHDLLAAAIQDEAVDISRITYHLIHDAYHLGRITHLRAMQGVKPNL